MHEFTHTQTGALLGRIDTLIGRGLPEDADDDVIQDRFGTRPDYRSAYEAERDLLFQATALRLLHREMASSPARETARP